MAGRLKSLDVERETKPGKYADGDGLYLIVNGPTSKNWSYRYWKHGKERWHGLGSFKDVSLKEARLARDAARLRVKGDRNLPGVDIVQERRAARQEVKAAEINSVQPTFEQCAEAYINEHWNSWSKRHRDQWPSSLKRYVYEPDDVGLPSGSAGWGEVLRALAQSDRGLPSGQYRTGRELRELSIVMGSGPRRASHQKKWWDTGWDSETVKHP